MQHFPRDADTTVYQVQQALSHSNILMVYKTERFGASNKISVAQIGYLCASK